jgi:hypothetical protein
MIYSFKDVKGTIGSQSIEIGMANVQVLEQQAKGKEMNCGCCAQCKHWDPQWPELLRGECGRVNLPASLAHPVNGADYGETLRTHAMFGCIQFEPASEEQITERIDDGISEADPK